MLARYGVTGADLRIDVADAADVLGDEATQRIALFALMALDIGPLPRSSAPGALCLVNGGERSSAAAGKRGGIDRESPSIAAYPDHLEN